VCDQQLTVVVDCWRQLRPQSSPGVVSNRPTTIACLSHSTTVDVPWPNFLSPEIGTQFQRALIFKDTIISLETVEGSPYTKNELDTCSRFDTIYRPLINTDTHSQAHARATL